MAEQENVQLVRDFFTAWEGGPYEKLRGAYVDYMAEDSVYENPGLPLCENLEATLAMIDGIAAVTNIASITAEVLGIAAAGDLVFSERIDHHFDASGKEVLTPRICGVMEVRGGKIVAWRDYFDPAALLQGMAAHAPSEA